MSQDVYLPVLNRFAREVWDNPGAVLKQHPGGFQFIDLGPYFDAFQSFFAGVVLNDKLLVKDEYRLALQALEEDIYKRGAYVVGQSGIGESWTNIRSTPNLNFRGSSHLVRENIFPCVFSCYAPWPERGGCAAVPRWLRLLRAL